MDQVVDPGGNWFNDQLRAFTVQELEHAEVAIALGGLRPEFTGDFYDGFHLKAIHFDGVETVTAVVQRLDVIIAIELV